MNTQERVPRGSELEGGDVEYSKNSHPVTGWYLEGLERRQSQSRRPIFRKRAIACFSSMISTRYSLTMMTMKERTTLRSKGHTGSDGERESVPLGPRAL